MLLPRRAALFAPVLALATLAAAAPLRAGEPGKPARLEIRPGDRITLIGNAFADRMQHDGWLEAYLHTRFPTHDLVFRNLGFTGDEVKLRDRSENFGSPDKWLTETKTDVVFAFFGYNESFAGDRGLPKFKKDLDDFVKHTLRQKYNGKSAPRLVLFAPIAHEDLHDRNLPDGTENNRRLEKYAAATAEVARANNVPFVDLFRATLALYPKADRPLTVNGVHLSEHGNEVLAQLIDKVLFPKGPEPKRTKGHLEKVRRAVLDRNFTWFNRYRTVDGYSIYGGRSGLKFYGSQTKKLQTNREVMKREMEVLDAMTANRDKRVWAVARGDDTPVDDSNLPPFIPVETNKPGKLPGGKHFFLSGEEAIQKMRVGPGMKINLFADEKQFPELVNPVAMAWDTKGRLWVAVWPTYPHWKPGEAMNDKLIILEDTDGDGKADKCHVFADGLHCPTGFEFYKKGVLVAQAPDLMYLEDTRGGDKANRRVRVLGGIDSADTHHTANSFVLDPGGALYFQEGIFHHTQAETPWGPPVRNVNAGVYRYEPRTQKFEVYVNYGFANPHGHAFDRWGQDIVVDGTGSNPYHATLFSGQTAGPGQRHRAPPQLYRQRARPCAGIEILSSRHFPEANQGNLLVTDVINFQGILQYKLLDKGASFEGVEVEPIVKSSDPNFRPSDIKVGPDGAIYFSDWHNPIIGHMQHNLRDPSRGREHGRIYRVTYPSRPLLKPVRIAGEPVEKLLDLLREPEDRVRYRVRIELGGRDSKEVLAAVAKWADRLDRKDAAYEHHLLEALWLHQYHNVVNEDLLRRMLRSPDFHARAAATRVLCYWRDRVQDPLALLRAQINDTHPRVRLEAIRALSFFHDDAALGVAIELLDHPDDQYLRYTFNETLATLERRLGTGTKLNRSNIAASLLRLLEKGAVPAERRPVLLETVCRYGGPKELGVVWEKARDVKGYPPALRRRALEWLADAAATRRAQPDVRPEAVRELLQKSAGEPAVLPGAIRLAAAWKVKEAAAELSALARDGKAPVAARGEALDGLAALDGPDARATLRELTAPPTAVPVRFRAAAALGRVDLSAGAEAAAKALASAGEADDPGPLVEGFLSRKGGPEKLAGALKTHKLSADTAKRVLRAMVLAGSNDPALAGVVGGYAGLDALVRPPTAAEVAKLAAEATAKGDAARGERVFRRDDLGCVKCHALNKAGGRIGPDLGPVGAASPLDYVITSILDPNASIKEEYLTKVITTGAGLKVTGVVVERTKDQVTLKDATGKRVRIPTADIDAEANGKSLMPEGITAPLTRGEVLDLIRFVSELGKPGPYALRPLNVVARWKRLQTVPAALREGVPNRDVLRDTVLRAGPEAWDVRYTLVNGTLPLDELHKPGKSEVVYLQADLDVTRAGPVEVDLKCGAPVAFWVDEEPFERPGKVSVRLTPGRHRITVRVPAGEMQGAPLRVQVRTPAKSRARFEVLQGE
jgi:putative heme-binding domain-containing protein